MNDGNFEQQKLGKFKNEKSKDGNRDMEKNRNCEVIRRRNVFFLTSEDPDMIPGEDRDRLFLGKKAGVYFYTKRRPCHFYKKYRGFGMNLELLGMLKQQRVEKIQIKYEGKEGVKRFLSSLELWFSEGVVVKNQLKPYDVQHTLSIEFMDLL